MRRGGNLAKYSSLFNFREPPIVKRTEFRCSHARKTLERLYGAVCQLQYPGICDRTSAGQVDHLIPLASNELNKKIRGAKPLSPGKKIVAESSGSNHISNLVLACLRCNGHKKHRFLEREAMRRILESKGF